METFIRHVGDIKTPFALAAFAIAAILVIFNAFAKKRTVNQRRSLWLVVVAICILALVPISIDAISQSQMNRAIYRVRVVTLDERNVPISSALVKTTSANEAKTDPDGSCELSIPKGTLPSSGSITIYAAKDNLHGRVSLLLQNDLNPSVTILLTRDRTAGIHGVVEDETQHVLQGVRVIVPGTKSVETNADGDFAIVPFAAPGEQVQVHVEKAGFIPTDQYVPAGDLPVTIVLEHDHFRKK